MDARTWDKAKDLIADLLELPKSERDAYLQAHCADPALVAEIRDIIKDYTDHSQFLEHPPQVSTFDDLEPDEDALEPGTQIGPYVVVDQIGIGGMSKVFLGNDRRLKRKIALKCLLASAMPTGDERARILREARAAAQISHANVAAIHDVIEHDEHVFIVMEYVEGEDLASRLRRDRLPIDLVVSIGRQLAAALGAAHAKGVVHRDLKPGNIRLMPDGTVKVLDFGVAKAMVSMSSASRETTAGRPLFEVRGVQPGTPEYMSPEQMIGKDVDARSDLFSLGVVLFEMATGRRPYPDANALERLHALEYPAPRADTIDPRVPPGLAEVIATALEADVHRRFQHATDVLAALERLQRNLETAATVVAPPRPARSMSQRAAVIAVSVAAAIGALGIFGLITTAAFNVALQRPARFANESLYRYVVLGLQSNVGLLVFGLALAAIDAAAAFFMRVLSTLPPVHHAAVRGRAQLSRWSDELGLRDPTMFGQSLAALGVIGLVAVIWWHQTLINAYMQPLSAATADRLMPLSRDNYVQRRLYRWSIDLLLVVVGLGAVRLVRLRGRAPHGGGVAAVGAVAVLCGIVILLHVVPYRLLFQNTFERIDVAGARCYLIDERDTEAFVFCPAVPPPRSRVIRRDDRDVRRLGVSESIFTPPFESEAP